jgi:hypothetical protein
MKYISLVFFFCMATFFAKAQHKKYNSVIYAEAGGAGVLYASINYDFRFNPQTHLGFGARFGFGVDEYWKVVYRQQYNDYFAEGRDNDMNFVITLPVGINYLFGSKGSPHTFEVGFNAAYLPKNSNTLLSTAPTYKDAYQKPATVIPSLFVGYRRQPVKNGFSWHIGYTPFYVYKQGYHWFGLGLGWKF